MQDLELYRYQRNNGGSGHVSGYGEQDARKRLTQRGLGDVDELAVVDEGIEDLYQEESLMRALDVQLEPSVPGWPPTAQETVYFQQIMNEPDFF